MKKRILSIILVFALCLTLLPNVAFATGTEEVGGTGSGEWFGYCGDDSTPEGAIGVGGGTSITWAIKIPAADLPQGDVLSKVSYHTKSSVDHADTYHVRIYSADPGTTPVGATPDYEQEFTLSDPVSDGWHDIDLTTPYEIDKTKDLWIGIENTNVNYPAVYSNEVLETTDCCMMYFSNQWNPITSLGSFQIQPWMIRGYFGTVAPAHTHAFTYTANNGKITATCTAGCDKGYDTTPLTLTLAAPASLVYDGNVKAFTFADGEADAWTGAGLELPTIYYHIKQSGQTGYMPLLGTLKDAGSYMAQITVDGKNAQVEFAIDKALPYIKTTPAPNDIEYGKKLSDSTLVGGHVQISSTDSTQVDGLFEWTNGDTKPAVSDSETTEYDVTFTPSSDYEANFITVTCKVKLKVNRAKTAVEPTVATGLVYDGTEQNGYTNEGNFVTFAGTKVAKSAGDYSFTATPDANYAWSDGTAATKTYNWEIAQKTATVKAADTSVRTGSTAPEFKVEFTDLLDADKTAVTEGFSPVFKLMTTGEAPEEIPVEDALKTPGEYTIVIANAGDLDAFTNYSFTVNNGKLTVTRRSSGGGGGSSSYTVKFETNGGSTIKNVSVRYGQKIGTIETPKKDGFVFDGWFSDKELTKPFNADEKVTKSTTLYAKWKVDPVRQIILTIDKKEAFVFTEEKVNDVAPKIVNDRTMLPIRFIAEALGAKVDWNGEKQLVTISNEGLKIEITIGKDVAFVNGKEIKLDSPAFIENSRTYTPVRFVAEALGATVEWNAENKVVTITRK